MNGRNLMGLFHPPPFPQAFVFLRPTMSPYELVELVTIRSPVFIGVLDGVVQHLEGPPPPLSEQ